MTAKTLNPKTLTEEQRDAFIEGWKNAGGVMGDQTPNPWCCPWYWTDEIEVEGETPYDWGASWWHTMRADVVATLASEETI